MRTPDQLWAEAAEVRRRLAAAHGPEAAALQGRLDALRAEAADMGTEVRRDELVAELAAVERLLVEVDERHIGGRTRRRGLLMGWVWGDHDSAEHLAALNRRMDEAGGRAALEARRDELRGLLGDEG